MFACLSSHGKTPSLISARTQAALHRFTNIQIFLLDAIGDFDAGAVLFACGCRHVGEIEVENYLRAIDRDRPNEVGVHHTFVQIDHEVWIEPIIKRGAPSANTSPLAVGGG